MSMTRASILILALTITIPVAAQQDPLDRGKAMLASGDTTLAVVAFKEAVKAGRKPAEASFALGQIAYAQKKFQDAAGYLKETIDREKDNVPALRLMGRAQLALGNPTSALTWFRAAIRYAPKDMSVSGGYGKALLALDSVDAAIVHLSRAVAAEPDSADYWAALGDAFGKQGVLVISISKYQKAVELQPKNVAYRYILAGLFYKNKQYNEAVKEYDGIIAVDPNEANAYLEKGRIFFLAKQYKNAVAPLQKLSQLQPKGLEGLSLYARSLFGAEDYAEAAKVAGTVLMVDSSDAEIWRVRAHSLVKMKDNQGAVVAFGGVQRRKAMKGDDMADYGAALVGVGREDEAIQALLEAVKADSSNCDTYYPLGFIYMKRQDYANAAASFEKKIACDPRSLSAYVNAAASYMQTKNFDRSRELLVKSIELKPDYLQGRLWLARYYAQMDSLEKAVEQYDEVLKIANENPDKYKRESGEAHMQKGQLYFGRKQYDRAIETFRKAVAAGTDNSALQLEWGQSLLQLLDPKGNPDDNQKKKEEAVQHFRRCVTFDPGNCQGHYWLGMGLIFLRKEGDDANNRKLTEEACGEFTKTLKCDPRNEDAKKARERYGCK
jgi:tetratricopeptide (TPR) repeat protein